VVGCWRGYLSERGADFHMAQLMLLPLTVSIASVNPDWFSVTNSPNPIQSLQSHKMDGCVCARAFMLNI